MARKQGRNTRSRNIALGGMFASLAIVLLLAGGVFPFATFVAPVFAGVMLLPVAIELGGRVALLAYATASILCFLLVPDRELCLFFVFLFGYYPILQPRLQRIKSKGLRLLAKSGLFNVATITVYVVLLLLFTSPALASEFASYAPWFWAVLLLLANFVFVVYDIMVTRLRLWYTLYLRKKLFK